MFRWAALSLLIVSGSLAGCSRSEAPPTKTVTAPNFSPEEIAERRRNLEQSLRNDSEGGLPNLGAALAPLNSLVVVPEWGLPETAADALARIGPAAVPTLMKALESPEPYVRTRAAQAMARMGPEASAAVPGLTRALRDQDPDVRRAAARALGQIGPAAETAIPALAVAMSQPEENKEVGLPTVVMPTPAGSPTPGRSPAGNR